MLFNADFIVPGCATQPYVGFYNMGEGFGYMPFKVVYRLSERQWYIVLPNLGPIQRISRPQFWGFLKDHNV